MASRSSAVWHYFEKDDEGSDCVKCTLCGATMKQSKGSTSSLSRHLSALHPKVWYQTLGTKAAVTVSGQTKKRLAGHSYEDSSTVDSQSSSLVQSSTNPTVTHPFISSCGGSSSTSASSSKLAASITEKSSSATNVVDLSVEVEEPVRAAAVISAAKLTADQPSTSAKRQHTEHVRSTTAKRPRQASITDAFLTNYPTGSVMHNKLTMAVTKYLAKKGEPTYSVEPGRPLKALLYDFDSR